MGWEPNSHRLVAIMKPLGSWEAADRLLAKHGIPPHDPNKHDFTGRPWRIRGWAECEFDRFGIQQIQYRRLGNVRSDPLCAWILECQNEHRRKVNYAIIRTVCYAVGLAFLIALAILMTGGSR